MTSSDIVLITGMSGSGKSAAVHALEDEGYFCIDNLPPALAKSAIDASPHRERIALVLDARSGRQLAEVPRVVDELRAAGHHVQVVFLDAGDETLIRRYSETRRRHPLNGLSVVESIAAERQALVPMRDIATRVIDTSILTRQDLRRVVVQGEAQSLNVSLVSFGFKYGVPVEADMLFDARHLQNPFFVPELRDYTGLDERVARFVMQHEEAREFLQRAHDFVRYLTPLYQREGKRYLTVAIGCTGGKHRSVTLVEAMKALLIDPLPAERVVVNVRHRDLERQ